MAFGLFMHRSDSEYDDVPAERYQFPKQYLGRAQACEGDWIIYLEPSKVPNTKGYFAVAKVQQIIPDPAEDGMYLALIEPGTYLDFADPVPFKHAGSHVEQGILNDTGAISGRAQAAVRPLSDADFARIIDLGLGRQDDTLPRMSGARTEMADTFIQFAHLPIRERVPHLSRRAIRDRAFRKTVLRAYGQRCAITGLRLINGGGRAEVEAAHIRPVSENGPDIISNGLALSGTAHWMFDRGLLGVAPDRQILISRYNNDEQSVRDLINPTGRLLEPSRSSDRPRDVFLEWHRQNCFKS